jgi:hypothetical protein
MAVDLGVSVRQTRDLASHALCQVDLPSANDGVSLVGQVASHCSCTSDARRAYGHSNHGNLLQRRVLAD